jgi:hypothetical protein
MGECAICQDVLVDPVLAGDGYPYCRICIGKWAQGRREWTSPLTARVHYGDALLSPDYLRAGDAREALRARVKALPPWQRLQRTAEARFGAAPLCSPSECAELLKLNFRMSERPDAWPWLLEVCWRAERLSSFPSAGVLALCEREKQPVPLLQRCVWQRLLDLCADRYRDAASERRTLLACREHFVWRLAHCDAVWAPGCRVPLAKPLLLLREAWCEGGATEWRSRCGARFRISSRAPRFVCYSELEDAQLHLPRGQMQFYRSREPVPLRGERLHARRREPAADSDSETVDSSESENEDELSVLESPLRALPEGFQYLPRALPDACPSDEQGALARVNELLVLRMLKRSTAQQEQRSTRARK